MAGADDHSTDHQAGAADHSADHGASDRGTWVLGVLVAAVATFALAGVVVKAVGADAATVATPAAVSRDHDERSAASEPSAADDPGPDAPPSTVAAAPAAAPTTTPPAVPSTEVPAVSSTTTPTPASVAPPAAGPTTPVPGPAAPSARPGGDGATAAESTFARLVRQHCDLARVPNPAQVRASDLGDGVFQIVDANATVMQIDVDSNIVMAADSLDGSVSGGYSEACAPALFGG
ncbi:MAG TPA: hypothetical protein PLY51_06950 [Microthrixaceae bacterium]|nr:hypothetical protein [Microthrixaceae bacterium]